MYYLCLVEKNKVLIILGIFVHKINLSAFQSEMGEKRTQRESAVAVEKETEEEREAEVEKETTIERGTEIERGRKITTEEETGRGEEREVREKEIESQIKRTNQRKTKKKSTRRRCTRFEVFTKNVGLYIHDLFFAVLRFLQASLINNRHFSIYKIPKDNFQHLVFLYV